MEAVAGWIVLTCYGYLAVGLPFGLWFALRGVNRVDPDAAAGSWGFRVLILPGSVALWPCLLRSWLRAQAGRGLPLERGPHRNAARSAAELRR